MVPHGMCSCIPFAGLSTQAASQGSSPAPAAKPAAPDLAQLHGGLDLLGEVQPPPATSATPEPAASGQALRAQSDDSLVALGRGDQEKSLSLSGWNRDSPLIQGPDMPGSSACPETQPAQVAHLTPTTRVACHSGAGPVCPYMKVWGKRRVASLVYAVLQHRVLQLVLILHIGSCVAG